MQDDRGDQDDDAGADRACGRERDVVGVEAEGDDDEDDLEALEEDALEGDDEAEPVEPELALGTGRAGGRKLLLEDRVLVVDGLETGGAENRLAQPLEAEDEKERADEELKEALGEPCRSGRSPRRP